ncbi:MAG: transposase [bacterium]
MEEFEKIEAYRLDPLPIIKSYAEKIGLEEIKKSSSVWMKENCGGICSGFAWQSSYGAFSLGQSQLSALLRYTANGLK